MFSGAIASRRKLNKLMANLKHTDFEGDEDKNVFYIAITVADIATPSDFAKIDTRVLTTHLAELYRKAEQAHGNV